MLPTFVIGLREGLEAALIVGIIAAFLRKQGRTDLLRQVWVGVGAAVAICVAVGTGLEIYSRDLPQAQQEGLETVIGVLAVAMVTYMVIWMKEHSRGLKAELESLAAGALSPGKGASYGAGTAMVAMAFLAVLREGFETAVFLLAAFNEANSGASALVGAVVGIAVAVALGYAIYRGGVRINLSKFFRATGLVLVLVAAGLVATALHTAHEAGWLDVGQQRVLDLSWLVQPGSVLSSLLTGILGLQPRPVLAEVLGWVVYAVPVGMFVAWPQARRVPRKSLVGGTAVAAVAAVVAVATVPAGGSGETALIASEQSPPAHRASVTITAKDGCSIDHPSLAAGGIDFSVRNVDATGISEVELLAGERIVGEKENLPPGFTGTFSVTAPAGRYTLYCPGAAVDKTPVTVTGKSTRPRDDTARLLRTGTTAYARYVATQAGYLVAASERLDAALHGNDLRAARVAYARARPFYEKIEPVAESFSAGLVNLDADIDARANDVPPSEFRGFHRIEKGLWADRSLNGLAKYGDELVTNVKQLRKLTKGLHYQPTELASGAQELLDEVASSKITGEEERYSHIDLLDVANNVEGSQQAFAQLQPGVRKLNPTLARTIATRFAALDRLVESYRDTSAPSGYLLYTSLNGADKRRLAAAVKAVQEPLSQVASLVAR